MTYFFPYYRFILNNFILISTLVTLAFQWQWYFIMSLSQVFGYITLPWLNYLFNYLSFTFHLLTQSLFSDVYASFHLTDSDFIHIHAPPWAVKSHEDRVYHRLHLFLPSTYYRVLMSNWGIHDGTIFLVWIGFHRNFWEWMCEILSIEYTSFQLGMYMEIIDKGKM